MVQQAESPRWKTLRDARSSSSSVGSPRTARSPISSSSSVAGQSYLGAASRRSTVSGSSSFSQRISSPLVSSAQRGTGMSPPKWGHLESQLDGVLSSSRGRKFICERPTQEYDRQLASQNLSTSPRLRVSDAFFARTLPRERLRSADKRSEIPLWEGDTISVETRISTAPSARIDNEDGAVPPSAEVDVEGAQKGMFHRLMHLYEKDEQLARRTAAAFWNGTSSRAHRKPYLPSQESSRKEREQAMFAREADSVEQVRLQNLKIMDDAQKTLPQRDALRYHLPDQARLLLQDQSWDAAKWGVWKSDLDARRLREKELAMQRLAELMRMEGSVAAKLKENARKAIAAGDLKGALEHVQQAQAAYGGAEKAVWGRVPSAGGSAKAERTEVDRTASCWVHLKQAASIPEGGEEEAYWGQREEEERERKEEARRRWLEEDEEDYQRRLAEGDAAFKCREAERTGRLSGLTVSATSGGRGAGVSSISMISKRLTEVPEKCLVAGSALRSLNLRVNDIVEVPPSLCAKCPSLDTLDLSHNRISFLPSILGNLTALRRLNIAGNRLVCLPSSLGWCNMLCTLNASDNQLFRLPPTLARLGGLAELSLSGNRHFLAPPQEVVDKGVQHIREHLSGVLGVAEAARAKLWSQMEERGVALPSLLCRIEEAARDMARKASADHSTEMQLKVINLGGGGYQIQAVSPDEEAEGAVVGACGERKFGKEAFDEVLRWLLRFRLTREEVKALWEFLDESGTGESSAKQVMYHLKKPSFRKEA